MDGFMRRKEMKKTDILNAALALFMEYGVQKVSIAEIAKKANVSQVTIYNYYESKENLVHEVIVFYIDKEWKDYEELLKSDLTFPEKIKRIIFNKKETASKINEDFYQYFMREYAAGMSYLENLYIEKTVPSFIKLFNEGKEKGYIDPDLSNEAILFYIQMMKEYMQREDVYQKILPMTEDLMKLLFYGIMGGREE
ncbi:TetR/AcrR family transcriptional regulator [Lederbergia wuyishanensis]|uniref:AcrR family transcriptional regulator n=1 Tax=Lederbergia wuyishanensis TaxID=1347903 RepID=A0ABU0D6M3_9BACI|nr:TetR/AcrR family transcriptional regulator [Lederbergia wuyishanensis]MCJ8008532.1 TetR/AcrR family transcriptional regulator [Lederbergia wuyishanensis]MDQ0344054.1 AcrR family transcriptional regulator [Lederbergia wuyishanensis]